MEASSFSGLLTRVEIGHIQVSAPSPVEADLGILEGDAAHSDPFS